MRYILSQVAALIALVALGFSTLAGYVDSHAFLLCFVAAAFWGAADVLCNSLISTIVSYDMDSKIEVFAIYKTWQGIGVMIGQLLAIIFKH